MNFLSAAGDALWNPWLLGLFLATGAYFTLRTGFFQIFGFRIWLRATVGGLFKRGQNRGNGVTRLQAMSTALAATIGTGSVAGVATAIFWGGPGAVFWMWISAFLGMMTGCAEKILAVRYRRRGAKGWEGGPMCYMEDGLKMKGLAKLFSAALILQTLIGGGMVQANSIAVVLNSTLGWNKVIIGLFCALLTGMVTLGGIHRIGRVSELLVPLMAVLFVGGGLAVIIVNRQVLPEVFGDIFRYAFEPAAAVGGYSAGVAMRFGIARGVFTNEAGMGSSAIAHAAAEVEDAAEQGMWGIFEVFLATLVICSVTAMVILTSGVYTVDEALSAIVSNSVTEDMMGAPLTSAAFSTVLGSAGKWLVAVCLAMFAFTSLLGAGFYGERGMESLAGGKKGLNAYRIIFFAVIVTGSVGEVSAVWQLTDLSNGLLALPNLLALLLLSPEALRHLREYERRKRK